jgi:hypothetical protein
MTDRRLLKGAASRMADWRVELPSAVEYLNSPVEFAYRSRFSSPRACERGRDSLKKLSMTLDSTSPAWL